MSVSAILGMIEARAKWVGAYAKQTAEAVDYLQARRSFVTKAEDELDRAERELVTALRMVRTARKQFAARVVNDRAA